MKKSWAFTQLSKHNISKSTTLYSAFESKETFFLIIFSLGLISVFKIYVLGQDDMVQHSKDCHISLDLFLLQKEPSKAVSVPFPPRPTPQILSHEPLPLFV